LLEQPKQHRANARANDSARHQHRPHPVIDAPAPGMSENPGNACPRHLAGSGSRSNGRRYSVENHQRRGQEPAPDPEHARKDPRQRAERDDHQAVDRKVGDRKVNIHFSAIGLDQREGKKKADFP
jgi:hypothetical protein